MTPLEEEIEWSKCYDDVVYFINKYWKIPKYDYRMKDPQLYEFQKSLVGTLISNPKVLINSARQMGITNVVSAILLHKMLFTSNHKVIHMNANIAQGIHVLNSIRKNYESLSEHMKNKFQVDNKREVKLSNGSSFKVLGDEKMGDVIEVDTLYIDNASFTKDFQERHDLRWGNPPQVIIASTIYKDSFFLDECKKAENNESDYTYVKLPYYVHPKRDRLWRSNQERATSVDNAIVECDCTHFFDIDGKISKITE